MKKKEEFKVKDGAKKYLWVENKICALSQYNI